MSDFKKLTVWRNAHALALNVHRVTAGIRGGTNTSLRNQIARAAFSVPTNLVEGAGQNSRREFARFISVALNSASELEYHLIVAGDLRLILRSDFESLTAQTIEVRKMLHGLRNRVNASPRLSRSNVPTS